MTSSVEKSPSPAPASTTTTTTDVTVSNGADGGDDGNKSTPRLPRWTRHEILVLIEGKRVAENQVRRGRANQQTEPKWVSISSYCKRHGVNREPVQCRKRWSNLAGDFRKIKEWDSQIKEEADSFWIMRNDLRRERKLPGFFDKEIYDVLDKVNVTLTGTELVPVKDEGGAAAGVTVDEEEDEAVFDSGRTAAAEDGLFSDFEQSKQEDDDMDEPQPPADSTPKTTTIPAPLPISERRYQPLDKAFFDQGRVNRKQAGSGEPEKGEGQKRRKVSSNDESEEVSFHASLVRVLENNNKMMEAQLEAQNMNSHLDRDQRKDHGDSLVAVLDKLADALVKIAEKI